ncbi:MAG: non-heme iron oxygenase ferredoxin subunit [Planctomycetota bacterium]|jgi:nitrite reductase/ring-hydroxylating ferredoxin subunit
MAEFVKVATVAEIADGGCKKVEVNGRSVGLFNLGGTIYAIDDTCTHADASLCDGGISGDEVVCPLHAATFNIRTGAATGPPAYEDVATYPVRISGDDVEIECG